VDDRSRLLTELVDAITGHIHEVSPAPPFLLAFPLQTTTL